MVFLIGLNSMKKVLGLCVVILLSSVSVFAQGKGQRAGKERVRDHSKRFEKLAEELKLSDTQIAEFEKLNATHKEKMQAEREAMKAEREKQKEKMIAMRDQRNEEVKKILSDEQYQLYVEKQKAGMEKQREKMSKNREKGDRPHHKRKRPHDKV